MPEQERPRPSPTFQKQIERMLETIEQAIDSPDVLDAFVAAEDAAERCRAAQSDEESRRASDKALEHVEKAISLIRERTPEAASVAGEQTLRSLLYNSLLPDLPPLGELRLRGVPGYPGRPLWVLLHEADVAAMREALEPGQIWVNASELTEEQLRGLWGAISYQQQVHLRKVLGRAGRPKGSIARARMAVMEIINARPTREWSYVEVYRLGVEHGLWKETDYYAAPERNKARVRRLLKTAQESREKNA